MSFPGHSLAIGAKFTNSNARYALAPLVEKLAHAAPSDITMSYFLHTSRRGVPRICVQSTPHQDPATELLVGQDSHLFFFTQTPNNVTITTEFGEKRSAAVKSARASRQETFSRSTIGNCQSRLEALWRYACGGTDEGVRGDERVGNFLWQ